MGINQGPGTQLRAASQYLYRLRYAFATLHVHGALYKERGLLAAGGKGSKLIEILKLLEVVGTKGSGSCPLQRSAEEVTQ